MRAIDICNEYDDADKVIYQIIKNGNMNLSSNFLLCYTPGKYKSESTTPDWRELPARAFARSLNFCIPLCCYSWRFALSHRHESR